MAKRLKQCVREEDIVARLGGDEFTIILSNLKDSKSASNVAAKIINVLQLPIVVEKHQLNVSGSIGITIAPEDSLDATELMRHASHQWF